MSNNLFKQVGLRGPVTNAQLHEQLEKLHRQSEARRNIAAQLWGLNNKELRSLVAAHGLPKGSSRNNVINWLLEENDKKGPSAARSFKRRPSPGRSPSRNPSRSPSPSSRPRRINNNNAKPRPISISSNSSASFKSARSRSLSPPKQQQRSRNRSRNMSVSPKPKRARSSPSASVIEINSNGSPSRNAPCPLKIRQMDFTLVTVPMDGHCLFHSLAITMNPELAPWRRSKRLENRMEQEAHAYRQLAADYIQGLANTGNNAVFPFTAVAEYLPKAPEPENLHAAQGTFNPAWRNAVRRYVRNLRGRLWGGSPEIETMALLLGRYVRVYSVPSSSRNTHYNLVWCFGDPRHPSIYILYNGSNHYDALFPN